MLPRGILQHPTKAEQATLFLTRQIQHIDKRVANLNADADPGGIVAPRPPVADRR